MYAELVRVRRHIELHGADESELERRIDKLWAALNVRRGTILDVERYEEPESAEWVASVIYQVPMVAGRLSSVAQ